MTRLLVTLQQFNSSQPKETTCGEPFKIIRSCDGPRGSRLKVQDIEDFPTVEMLANVKRHMAAQPPAVWEQGPLVQVVLQFPCGSRLHSRVHGGVLFYALAGHLPSPTLLLTPASLPSPSGSPAAKLTSDRGPRFTSSAWSAFCCSHSIEHITTTAYHPQSNGMVEFIGS